MNRAITVIYKDGTPSVLTGPEVPIRDQTMAFKELIRDGHEGAELAELWTASQGLTRRKRLPVKQKPAPKKGGKTKAPEPDAAEANEVKE